MRDVRSFLLYPVLLVAAYGCSSAQPADQNQPNAPASNAPASTMANASGRSAPNTTTSTAGAGTVAAMTMNAGGAKSPQQTPSQGGAQATAAGNAGSTTVASAGSGGMTSMQAGAGGAGNSDAGTPDAGGATADDLCQVSLAGGAEPMRPQLSGNTFAHDPTMIEADGVYYRFWTGDNLPMATSRDLNSWSDGPAVYRNGYPDWSREWLAGISGQTFNFPWAPDVSFFNGKHHIYSSFSAKFGDNISCITHLTTDDIASGNWTDHGPVICTKGDEKYNAIDADVGFDTEGKAYFAFGSFWDGIMAFPLDSEGARVGDELTRLAWQREIEAPVLFRRCGWYYLFVSHGLCCPGQGRSVDQLSYRVVVGRSKNILGPYEDKEGVAMIEGGGTVVVKGNDTYAAAGHSDILVANDRIYNLYHAYRRPRGNAELRMVELQFDANGWPVAHEP